MFQAVFKSLSAARATITRRRRSAGRADSFALTIAVFVASRGGPSHRTLPVLGVERKELPWTPASGQAEQRSVDKHRIAQKK